MPPIGAATVSVILPTYNRAQFLPAAFASIANQTFTDWELVIVDDGSTDNTPDVVRAFETSKPVRCVRQDNRGAYAARNRGLDEASGTYVAFFDSDDLWLPHHLQRCVQALGAMRTSTGYSAHAGRSTAPPARCWTPIPRFWVDGRDRS